MTNCDRLLIAQVPVKDGKARVDGDYAVDGVFPLEAEAQIGFQVIVPSMCANRFSSDRSDLPHGAADHGRPRLCAQIGFQVMARTVAEHLVDTLARAGVRQIFGVVGDSLNPVTDALRRSPLEWVDVRHEETAAFTGELEDVLDTVAANWRSL
jgi:hypothetical protein